MCGENLRYADFMMKKAGSPPHVWGKHETNAVKSTFSFGKNPVFNYFCFYDYIIIVNC